MFTECGHFLLARNPVRYKLDDGGDNFAESVVRSSNYRHVVNIGVPLDNRFHFDGIDVFPPADHQVLFSIDKINKAVFVAFAQIPGKQPAVSDRLGRQFGVFIIFLHEAGALDNNLPDLTLGNIFALVVNDTGVPQQTRFSDGTDFGFISDPEVQRSRSGGLTQSIGVVKLHPGEIVPPAVDQTGGDGLSAHVKQTPLGQIIIFLFEFSAIQGLKNVQRPGDQKKNQRDPLVGDVLKNIGGGDFLGQKNGPSAGEHAPEQMPDRQMIKRRQHQKAVGLFPALVGGFI